MNSRSQLPKSRRPPGQVRIIAGKWRGRRLPVPALAELRPTPDRLRETLFNWLQPVIPGAHCLDLFAGTGALGFEAASRGAARVVLVERNPDLAQLLREQVDVFGAGQIEVHVAEALSWLKQNEQCFDIVFLDPPFDGSFMHPALALIETRAMLRVNGLVYMEGWLDMSPPPGWEVFKQTKAGRVKALLIRAVTDASAA